MPLVREPIDTQTGPLRLSVVGPDAAVPSASDLRRLLEGRALSRRRREGLAAMPKVIALHGSRVVGLAAYERGTGELRVIELAFASDLAYGARDVLRHLLDGVELACVAGGCRRLVLMPTAVVATGPLEELGYRVATNGQPHCWLEKRLY